MKKRAVKNEDLTGQKFGRLTATKLIRFEKGKKTVWLWDCDCGKQREILVDSVKSGKTKSCGCAKIGNKNGRIHGGIKTRLYRIWHGMKTRCNNVNDKHYSDYGGRGIKIYEEWYDFSIFQDWADENGYEQNLTIDRINNNGNYEPSNCKWSTTIQQNRNRRNNIYLEINGETKLLIEWCEILNVRYPTAFERRKAGNPCFTQKELQPYFRGS